MNKITTLCLCISLMTVFSCNPASETKEAAVPTEAELPSDEELAQIGIQKMGEWTSYWTSKGANLDFNNFTLAQEHTYETTEWPGENLVASESPLKEYQIPHPGKEGVVDIYGYKLLLNEDGEVSYNTDAEVVYYKPNGMRERLLFIGPSGVFEDAVWISEEELLVSGHIQKENGFSPVLWLIKPQEHKFTVYENSFSTPDYVSDSFLRIKLKNLNFPSETSSE
ncbi:MAG TPA: hypothetical protein VKX33_03460 [Cyclobacteriaceae bacterium]|nr:hypothetical protein [Cyclobacteriaceae bacterium]